MRSALKLSSLAVLSLLIGIGAACGSNPVTPQPPPLVPEAPPRPPPPDPPTASLAIEDPFVIVRSSRLSARFEVEVRFLLRETGGNSGATIRSIFLGDGQGGGEMRDGICTDGLRVPAGGVLHTFYTDEGFASLGYCSTYLGTISTPTFDTPVIVTVTFADDEGRVGSVAGRTVAK